MLGAGLGRIHRPCFKTQETKKHILQSLVQSFGFITCGLLPRHDGAVTLKGLPWAGVSSQVLTTTLESSRARLWRCGLRGLASVASQYPGTGSCSCSLYPGRVL